MIRVVLPQHLRKLARVDGEVTLEVSGAVTQRSVLDALEARYPMLRGTIRDHVTQRRRAYVRFFACQEDLSNEATPALVLGWNPVSYRKADGQAAKASYRISGTGVAPQVIAENSFRVTLGSGDHSWSLTTMVPNPAGGWWESATPSTTSFRAAVKYRLVALGFSRVRAVVFIWVVTLMVGLAAVNLRYLTGVGAVIALAQVVLFFLLIFVLEMQGKKAAARREQ